MFSRRTTRSCTLAKATRKTASRKRSNSPKSLPRRATAKAGRNGYKSQGTENTADIEVDMIEETVLDTQHHIEPVVVAFDGFEDEEILEQVVEVHDPAITDEDEDD